MSRLSICVLTLVMLVVWLVAGWCLHNQGRFAAQRIPLPTSPYFQNVKKKDELANYNRFERLPILAPLAPGAAADLDPPSDDEVVRAWEMSSAVKGGIPFLHETERNNVRIVKERIADSIDPPRVVPLIGPVQLHHAHYKCTIYYTEVTRVGWPLQHTVTDEDAQTVVYIDQNQFHMIADATTAK